MDRNCFFKIMFGKHHAKVMYLPPEFARKVEHLNDQEVEIEDISGCRWPVTVSRVNDFLAFKKGWKQFFLDHGLTVGKLLVFTFMEGSRFSVQVFTESGLERTNFGNEMPRQSKRRRGVQRSSSEDEPYQIADLDKTIPEYSVDRTISANLGSPGTEFQRRNTNFEVLNADFAASQPIPMPVNIEDPICTINRYDGCEGEHRNHLFDLSSFEMENRRSDAKDIQKALIGVSDPPLNETSQHVVNSENASGANICLSSVGVLEPTKPAGDNAMEQTTTTMKDAEIQTDLIMGNSGDISIKKIENKLDAKTALSRMEIADHVTKEVNAKTSLSHMEIPDQIKKKVDDTQMSPHSSQAGGHFRDAFVNKSYKEPSDKSNMNKDMLDNVCNFQDGNNQVPESFSVSPSIGSSKIAGRVDAAKSKFGEMSLASSAVKHPLGRHPIKKELVDMEEKANAFNDASYRGKGPIVAAVSNCSVKVKPEPAPEFDRSHVPGLSDTISSFTTCPFSAQVKSRLYLELPGPIIISAPGKKMNVQQEMVVFLKDSTQKIWPVFYCEYLGTYSFTTNWTKFCEHNNIKPGDTCAFRSEGCAKDPKLLVQRVEVTRGSGE